MHLSCDNKEDGGRKFSQSKQRGLEFKQTGSIGLIGFTGSVSTDAIKTETKLLYAQPMYVQSLLCPFAVLVLFLYTTKSLKMPFLFCFYYSDKATWKVIRISLE